MTPYRVAPGKSPMLPCEVRRCLHLLIIWQDPDAKGRQVNPRLLLFLRQQSLQLADHCAAGLALYDRDTLQTSIYPKRCSFCWRWWRRPQSRALSGMAMRADRMVDTGALAGIGTVAILTVGGELVNTCPEANPRNQAHSIQHSSSSSITTILVLALFRSSTSTIPRTGRDQARQ